MKLKGSTLPPKTKIIRGKRYKLAGRYETKKAAKERAETLRRWSSTRIGFSARVVPLPKSEWGAVDWDVHKFAIYIRSGRSRVERLKGLGDLFE